VFAQRPVVAQSPQPTSRPTSLSVFLDCNFYCDEDFVRTELTFVNWVRDRAVADVHILGTSQTAGAGQERTLTFIGLRAFASMADTLKLLVADTDTDDERRRAVVRMLKAGMVRFIARTTVADRLEISVKPGAAGTATSSQTTKDPWKFWVFRTSVDGHTSGDANNTFMSISGGFSARRTTDAWKVELEARENYNQSTFTIDEEKSTFIRRNYNFNQLLVRSVGPRTAVGVKGSLGSSTYDNKRFYLRAMPAIEFDVFPYSQSTRRLLTAQYAVGYEAFRYTDVTIYAKLKESHPLHTVALNLNQNQPWGSAGIRAEAGQYLDMTHRNYAEVGGDLSVRIVKGLNFNIGGEYEAIRNQLYLPAEGASAEEILTQQRQLATNYQYFVFAGISYTFGSVLNNVVNPRFGRD
jgi:hypothetical protein